MKKLGMLVMALLLLGCADKNQDISLKEPTAENIILKIQEKLIETDKKTYKLLDLKSESDMEFFSYAKNFNQDYIKAGYALEPEDANFSAELIIVLEMTEPEVENQVIQMMDKVTSDQTIKWADYIESQKQLVKTNQIKRQDSFVLYVTSKEANDIVKLFQKQVR